MELNEQGGEANIATGYHAVEFLLWGQDQSEDGPGQRPVSDYVDAAHADRRGKYLGVVSKLLRVQLEGLEEAWAPKKDNYRAEFQSAHGLDALANILAGMIILSGFETGGERIQTALLSGDQEDEHSCFSDNTHRDMIQDIRGILNVYLGNYRRLDGSTIEGPGVRDAVATLDPELADDLAAQIRKSLELAEAIEPPFDQEIAIGNSEGRARLEALVGSLRDQEKLLEEVFRAFDLSIPEPE
jgi:putative iron-regulated protein